MFHFAFILRRPFTSINLFMEVQTRICKKTVTIDSLQVFSIPFKKQKVRIFIPQVGASVAIKEGFILRELRWKQENEKLTKFTNHQMCQVFIQSVLYFKAQLRQMLVVHLTCISQMQLKKLQASVVKNILDEGFMRQFYDLINIDKGLLWQTFMKVQMMFTKL